MAIFQSTTDSAQQLSKERQERQENSMPPVLSGGVSRSLLHRAHPGNLGRGDGVPMGRRFLEAGSSRGLFRSRTRRRLKLALLLDRPGVKSSGGVARSLTIRQSSWRDSGGSSDIPLSPFPCHSILALVLDCPWFTNLGRHRLQVAVDQVLEHFLATALVGGDVAFFQHIGFE